MNTIFYFPHYINCVYSSYCTVNLCCIFWKVRHTEKKRDKQNDLASAHSLHKTPQQLGLHQSQGKDPGASSRSPTQVKVPKALGHPRLLCRPHAGTWMRSGEAGIRTAILMGSQCVQGNDFSHQATVPDLVVYFEVYCFFF